MAIKNWHGGKLVLVWVVGLLGYPLLRFVIEEARPDTGAGVVLVYVVLGLAVALLVTPLVVSWKWFSAREKKNPPSDA